MENASKAIELAIGAILFIVAVTVTILMYGNMINTVNTTLSINSIKTNIVGEQGNLVNATYNNAEVYFMLEGISEAKAKGMDAYSIVSVPTFSDSASQRTVTYTYQYSDSGINNLNNHKLIGMTIISH